MSDVCVERSAATLLVHGGVPLRGSVIIDGNRHSFTLAVAAAVATGSVVRIVNPPASTEVGVFGLLLDELGGAMKYDSDGTVEVHGDISLSALPFHLTRLIHGAIYLVPAVLARTGHVSFREFGGDHLGAFEFGMGRPISHLLEIAQRFGARWHRDDDGDFYVRMRKATPACVDIHDFSDDAHSYGGSRVSSATKCAVLLAMGLGIGGTPINPHVKEAESDLLELAQGLGSNVEKGGERIHLAPRASAAEVLSSATLTADPAELMTWAVLGLVTGGSVRVHGRGLDKALGFIDLDLAALSPTWREWFDAPNKMRSPTSDELQMPTRVEATSRGVNTDVLPFLVLAAALRSRHQVCFKDHVWPGRFGYVDGLSAMGLPLTLLGAQLRAGGRAVSTCSAPITVRGSDTRAVGVLVGAGLAGNGVTEVHGAWHLLRGYSGFECKVAALGGMVEVVGR